MFCFLTNTQMLLRSLWALLLALPVHGPKLTPLQIQFLPRGLEALSAAELAARLRLRVAWPIHRWASCAGYQPKPGEQLIQACPGTGPRGQVSQGQVLPTYTTKEGLGRLV